MLAARLEAAHSGDPAAALAAWLAGEFAEFYAAFAAIPDQARAAFEARDFARSVQLSATRLALYNERIAAIFEQLRTNGVDLASSPTLWEAMESRYLETVQGRYEADIAIAFVHSVRRKIYEGQWTPVEYSFGSLVPEEAFSSRLLRTFPGAAVVEPWLVEAILAIPGLKAPFADLSRDAAGAAARVNALLAARGARGFERVEMVNAGFFRNRGAYLVGRIVVDSRTSMPLVLALAHEPDGVVIEGVVAEQADAHNLFSSTLANFHVTNPNYHELCEFLHAIMPNRPLGLHYSTIGYNHLGKVAVMNELRAELAEPDQRLATSPGFRGTVAIGFSGSRSAYNLKVIRDKPTAGYKWGEFAGVPSVLRKYARVHDINRTGSMLDNIIYYNVALEQSWFDPELLAELVRECSGTVHLLGDTVVFRHLIVQRRLSPLPVFLETASDEDARTAIVNLGYCIKNNAAANIFNKDLDARNYGVSRHHKVYLFDYDALEDFVDVKVRSNADRIDGEEDVPDWFFEEGEVFLPEEIEVGLQLRDRRLRRLFREVHGDLYETGYWEAMQAELRAGRVPSLRVYPESARL